MLYAWNQYKIILRVTAIEKNKRETEIQNAKKSKIAPYLVLAIYFDLCKINKIDFFKKRESVDYIGWTCVQDCEYVGIHTKETTSWVLGEILNGPCLALLPLVIKSHHEILALKRWVLQAQRNIYHEYSCVKKSFRSSSNTDCSKTLCTKPSSMLY